MQDLATVAVLVLGDDEVQNAKVSSLMLTGNRLVSKIHGLVSNDRNLFGVASVIAVSRCVVSANMLLGGQYAPVLFDAGLPQAQVVVMSNLLDGRVSISPGRDSVIASAPYPMNTCEFVNTLV